MSLGIKIKTAAGYVFETVVNLCALVNGGQHLFSLRTSAGWCVCFFLIAVRFGWVWSTAISKGVSSLFGRRQNLKLAFVTVQWLQSSSDGG